MFPSAETYDNPAWTRAAKSVSNLDVTPLECKGIYTVGLVRSLIEGAGWCMKGGMHGLAFVGAISAVETLGQIAPRVRGGNRRVEDVLSDGLHLVANDRSNDDVVVVETTAGGYTVNDCMERRRFSAHGGGGSRRASSMPQMDHALTAGLLGGALDALDQAWSSWREGTDDGLRSLAVSETAPLFTGGVVVFVRDLHSDLSSGAMPGGEVMHQEMWR